jgi:hypothetical protein
MQRLKGVKLCGNSDVEGFNCGRAEGHQGKHVAFDEGGMVTCEWYPTDISGAVMIEFMRVVRKN